LKIIANGNDDGFKGSACDITMVQEGQRAAAALAERETRWGKEMMMMMIYYVKYQTKKQRYKGPP
jgi:hypothetical protein